MKKRRTATSEKRMLGTEEEEKSVWSSGAQLHDVYDHTSTGLHTNLHLAVTTYTHTHSHTDCKLYTYYIQQLYECHYTVDDSTENVKQFVIFLQRRDEKTHGSRLYSKYAAEASS